MHTRNQNHAQTHAVAVAEMLEQRLSTGDPADFDLLEDVLELKATTRVNLDERAVEAFVETWWRPTMEAALNAARHPTPPARAGGATLHTPSSRHRA